MFDLSKVHIRTDRLEIRKFEFSDLDDFYEYAKVDDVGQRCGWMPHKNKEESLEILTKFIENKDNLAIVKDGKVIGSIGLKDEQEQALKEKEVYNLGYCLSKDYWNNGYMTEAVDALLDYYFNVLNYECMSVCHFDENLQSKRVIEKSGFKYVSDGNITTSAGLVKHGLKYLQTKEEYNNRKKGN